MNKLLTILCLGAVVAFAGCKRETKDEKFQRDFQQFTLKECPMFVDRCTRLDSACYDIKSRTLTYYYTVQDELDNDSIYTEEMTDIFHDDILKALKSSLQLKGYKDEGITFCYNYRSMTTGKHFLELCFTKEDYD